MAGRVQVDLPWSKLAEALAKILTTNGYLEKVSVDGSTLSLILKYNHKVPAVLAINRVSKPSLRVYVRKNNLPRVLGGMGVAIISTPAGLMTDKQAREKGLGGEVICEIS